MKIVVIEGGTPEKRARADLQWWSEVSSSERLLAIESCRLDAARLRGEMGGTLGFQDSYRDLFLEMNRAEVRYLVVGGYAVGFHARPRYTKDIDILVEATLENAERFLRALTAFIGDTGLAAERFSRADLVFLTSIPGMDFAAAWERREEGDYAGEPVHFPDLDDLIASKKAAARPQDLLDVEVLERRRSL